MPVNVQAMLCVSNETDLPKLLSLADKIMEVTDSQISTTTISNIIPSAVTMDLQDRVSALREQVNQLSHFVRSSFRYFR